MDVVSLVALVVAILAAWFAVALGLALFVGKALYVCSRRSARDATQVVGKAVHCCDDRPDILPDNTRGAAALAQNARGFVPN